MQSLEHQLWYPDSSSYICWFYISDYHQIDNDSGHACALNTISMFDWSQHNRCFIIAVSQAELMFLYVENNINYEGFL